MCEKDSKCAAALALLREVERWHAPDIISYASALSACEKSQNWIAAMTLLREMQNWHMKPNATIYNTTISACDKGQQWITALALLREMPTWMRRNMVTYSATIRACENCSQSVEAVALLREMQMWHMNPDVDTYVDVICACEKDQRWMSGRALTVEMQQLETEAKSRLSYSVPASKQMTTAKIDDLYVHFSDTCEEAFVSCRHEHDRNNARGLVSA
eukprot:gnl/TRDRNA2_/TRDRNA2_124154_c0_seq1.p1 gnl/TRDRNA2_/TRDRNA2_124154_c0~~gnl/TRDRNA2_/TRDRNA2_124154_c0_seq1.p1  ORF type:complete len:230 (+),score=30.69 gnl/TRDRNA2_/TRDRNA2_124154_c0_seq1:45-692(+)